MLGKIGGQLSVLVSIFKVLGYLVTKQQYMNSLMNFGMRIDKRAMPGQHRVTSEGNLVTDEEFQINSPSRRLNTEEHSSFISAIRHIAFKM